MSTKLKALGLGLIAMLAMSAFAVVNAGAETGGHFTSEAETTIITGTEDGETLPEPAKTHTTELQVPGLTPITCTDTSYSGTTSAKTVTKITITPTYNECATTNATSWNQVGVHMNGCDYEFTIGKKATEDNTVDLVCTGENKIVITHGSSCTIHVPPKNGLKGVSYTPDTQNGKEAITLDATVKEIPVKFEAGFCVLLGTNHVVEMTGSVTVEGFEDIEGEHGDPVDITATGSEEL